MLSKVCNKIVNLLIENHIIQKDDREIYYFGLYQMISFIFLLIYNRVVDKMKVVYPFYESVIIKKPKKVNV